MKQLIALTSAAFAATATFAAPVVSDVTMTQDASKTVNITYKLKGEPGIVTVDIQTNGPNGWVSIGGEHLTYFAGDANKVVQPTGENETRKITWKPRKAWPDNEVTENVKAVLSAWALNAPPDYMAISLTVPNTVRYYASAGAVPFGVTDDMYKTDYLLMRKIPAANVEWRMGSPTTEKGRSVKDGREQARLVTLAEDYYIGVYEVTQRQYELVMGSADDAYFNLAADRATRPMENITYDDMCGKNWPTERHAVLSTSFVGKLRNFAGLDGFDLPTHAQWEFACRAGCGAALYNGMELEDVNSSTNLIRLSRYQYNDGYVDGKTAPSKDCTAEHGTAKVGSYEPNAWGLYDMLGNVAEQCLDWQTKTPADYGTDGAPTGTARWQASGFWSATASNCRAATVVSLIALDKAANTVGFRIVCSIDE